MWARIILLSVGLLLPGPVLADVNTALENICNIVTTNDKSALRKKMRTLKNDFRTKFKDVYPAISCGGQSLLRSAMLAAADDTGKLMVKRLPKSLLAAAEADGQTLKAWAESQGLTDSVIFEALNKRL